jgi:hypothetical protein
MPEVTELEGDIGPSFEVVGFSLFADNTFVAG